MGKILVSVDLLNQTIKVLHGFPEFLCLLGFIGNVLLPKIPRRYQGLCRLLCVPRGLRSCCSKAHLQKVSCLLGELGAYVFKVLLVELAIEVAGHLLLVEGPVFAERAHKLDPATGKKQGAEASRVPGSSAAASPNPAASPETGLAHGPLKGGPSRGTSWDQ